MIAEIIAIGTEITTGSTENSNTKFLSGELMDLGIDVFYHTSVDDDPYRLSQVIEVALSRADLIFTTGGLGPTKDDMSKEVIAKTLGLKLISDKDMEEKIIDRFKGIDNMPLNNLRQATKPEGSNFINNSIGTAPGIYIEYSGSKIFMMPGPPKEMKLMFNNEISPILKDENSIIKRSINIFGVGESKIEMDIEELLNLYDDVYVATFSHGSQVEVKLIGKGKNRSKIKDEINYLISKIEEIYPDNIYGYDNISIEEVVVDLLKKHKKTIGFCESCTGGLLSSKITKIPGASEVFDRSIITYSNNAKMEEVGVLKETLDIFGAVSRQTAQEMSLGLLKHGVDIAVSVTGIAGPDTDKSEKPVGLVYIAVANNIKTHIIELNLNGDRETIQRRSANGALFELYKFIKFNY